MLIKIIMMVLMFTTIVVIHEWGHYITAKKCGVLVHEFAIGMGPKIWSIQKGETLYSVRIFPIGGFCSMEEDIGKSSNPRAMSSKKPWQKLLIVSAGAIMNFILAWVLISVIIGYGGYSGNVIETVEPNMPAQTVGLMSGDKIIAIDGIEVKRLSDITNYVVRAEKTYTLSIVREKSEPFDIEVTTKQLTADEVARFGFTMERLHYNIIENVVKGFTTTCNLIKELWNGFLQIITGQVAMDQLAGIVGVVDASAKQWDSSLQTGGISLAIMNMLSIAAMLSANLAIINLLPLPALDGGRIVFILVELLRGKPIEAEKEGAVHFIGFVLLMLLTVVVFYNDIMRLIP